MKAAIASFFGFCLIAATPTVADVSSLSIPGGPYKDASTGMIYPESLGDFRRTAVTRNDKIETARYEDATPDHEIAISVRVYVSPNLMVVGSQPPAGVLSALLRGICMAKADDDMKALSADAIGSDITPVSLKTGMFSSHDGYRQAYTLTAPAFFGHNQFALESDVYRYCYLGPKHLAIEYRVDYAHGDETAKKVEAFMHDLDWSFL